MVRGGDEIVASEGGVLELNVFPLIGALLVELQEMGVVDAAAEIPDLTGYRPPVEAITQLEAVLDVELPDDIGTIRLIDSEQLAVVQQGVEWFDFIVLLSLGQTALFAVLAVAVANYRLRMLLWLSIGAVIAVGLARTFARIVMDATSGAVADGPGATPCEPWPTPR